MPTVVDNACGDDPCVNGVCTPFGNTTFVCECDTGYAGRLCECFDGGELGLTELLQECNALITTETCCQPGTTAACDMTTTGIVCPGSCNGRGSCIGLTGYASQGSCLNCDNSPGTDECPSPAPPSPAEENSNACFMMSGFAEPDSCLGSSACNQMSGYASTGTCVATGYSGFGDSGTCAFFQGFAANAPGESCDGSSPAQCNNRKEYIVGPAPDTQFERFSVRTFCPDMPPPNAPDGCGDFLQCCFYGSIFNAPDLTSTCINSFDVVCPSLTP